MKRVLIFAGIGISAIMLFIIGSRIYTKSFSPEDQALFRDGDVSIKVAYCRPSKKGRDIFGGLEPYGEVWRTGANEATQIELSDDFKVKDKILKAGKYSLFTIPGKDEWVIIFNKQTGQWGTVYNESRDAARVSVERITSPTVTEKFTIEFEKVNGKILMVLKWDDTIIKVPFEEV